MPYTHKKANPPAPRVKSGGTTVRGPMPNPGKGNKGARNK